MARSRLGVTVATLLPDLPEREPGQGEVPVEGERHLAALGSHQGEARGVGVGDDLVSQTGEPPPRLPVDRRVGEEGGDPRACLDPVEGGGGGEDAGAEEDEPVYLGEDQVAGEEGDLPGMSRSEATIGRLVLAVPRAEEGEPGPDRKSVV